jgi:phosphohistidine phosphatase
MDLILWRHADAADGVPDEERPLTQRGREQAALMADWLKAHTNGDIKLYSSPLVRARQTAMALSGAVKTVVEAAPGAAADEVLAAVGWPGADGTAIVVGHQPDLGEIASTLLVGEPIPVSLSKGAVWWFRADFGGGRKNVRLVSVMTPELLRPPAG